MVKLLISSFFVFELVSLSWTYNLVINSTLPSGAAIFDTSMHKTVHAQNQSIYLIKHSYTNEIFPFTVDKSNGILFYTSKLQTLTKKNSCSILYYFDVTSSDLHNHTFVKIPFDITVASPEHHWEYGDAEMKQNKYTVISRPVSVITRDVSVILDSISSWKNKDCPNFIFPKSLCTCQVDSFLTFSTTGMLKIQQAVTDCHQNSTFVPSQVVQIQLNVASSVQMPDNGRPHYSERKRRRRASAQIHFKQNRYTYMVKERAPARSWSKTIQAYEHNGQLAHGVTYRMEARANRLSLDMFDINSGTGEITNRVVLDRENMPQHKFRITATKANSNQASCYLTINVEDANDNRPVFEQPNGYKVFIEENQQSRTHVAQITAYDADTGKNSEIHYSISHSSPGHGRNIFSITNDGDLITSGTIDREKYTQYNLTIEARDGGEPPLSSRTVVTVNILDQNDNAPQFIRSSYSARIKENVSPRTLVVIVSAKDDDAGSNGDVTYSIISGNTRKFSIDSKSGQIKVRGKLDFEDGTADAGQYALQVRATDHGRPPLTNTTVVKITLVDINDNPPSFYSSPYQFHVRETLVVGETVGQVDAYDTDSGLNSKLSYSIDTAVARQTFSIVSSSGVIKLRRALDYERTKSYQFVVVASDNGNPRRTAPAQVEIIVINENDNAPHFTQRIYQTRVPEDAPFGYEVITVRAEDADKQESIGIRYTISRGNSGKVFTIVTRDNAGIIKLNQRLDYSQNPQYILTVVASDGMLQSATTVTISITDTNSYQPIFDKSSYSVSINENVQSGTVVETVHASDDDDGENARITYCFVDDIRDFDIDEDSGIITTKRLLDYESKPVIQLNIRAHDNGVPQKEDFTIVTVYLQDINDNAPEFIKRSYRGSVSEDSKLHTRVVTIHASDRDSANNKRVHYTFENGDDGDGDFSIDRSSGMIRTAALLDRESVSQYKLVAFAVDDGSPPMSSSVTITIDVEDVDDNPPSFKNDTLTYYVKEDVPIGHVVATIKAVDPDLQTDHSEIRYLLNNHPDMARLWRLDSRTGVLSTMHKFDFETRKNYTLTVTASSNELVNQATIQIIVLDCNDNNPVFNDFQIVFNNYRSRTTDSFPTGVIGGVPAYDLDVIDKLTYRIISGNSGRLLLLNETTGELRLNRTLDSNRQYTVPIKMQVSDGLHHTAATCTLNVTGITDEMLQHSITVRVLHMNAYNFLSPVIYSFIDGIAEILKTLPENIYVFNVQNDTHVDNEILNVSFSARKDHDTFFTSKYLQDQIYLNRQILARITTKNVLPFDDNICLREPCQNYKRCTSVLTFNSSATFVSSPQIIFRPIHPVYKLKCECPIGFTNNETCSDEVDLCYSSPCLNEGSCQPTEGGYTCNCLEGFTGRKCEIDLKKASCADHPGICKNGGVCNDGGLNAMSCECKGLTASLSSKEQTVMCELLSRQFKPGNFLMLPGIRNQWHFTLSVSFATLEKSGLLFYNGRLNHEHDFMALELLDGQVQLNFSTGQSWTVVDPFVEGGVNDGQWHTVELRYFNEPKSDPLPKGVLNRKGPSPNKTVIMTIDPKQCDHTVAAKWRPSYGSYTCSKKVKQTSSKKSLDLTSPLLLGGVPDLPEAYQVHAKTYHGCLGNLVINGRKVDLGEFIENNGSIPGCSAMQSQCKPHTCKNEATCRPHWDGFKCDCKTGHTGKRCEHQNNFVGQLHGRAALTYTALSSITSFNLPWHESFSFRTFDSDAVLLHYASRAGLSSTLKISSGHIVHGAKARGRTYNSTLSKYNVSDGEWHEVVAEWFKIDASTVKITLDLDYGKDTSDISFSSASLSRTTISNLYIGGKSPSSRSTQHLYIGCFQDVQVGPPNPSPRLDINHLRGHFSRDCNPTNPCLSNPCPTNSKCIEKWTSYHCKCNTGYVGANCVSVCSLNLCQNGGTCVIDTSSERGYMCRCLSGFMGITCEKPYTELCPLGWFGSGICAPCNCPSSLHFDSVCNGTNGECICKKNHYYTPSTKSCKPCNCYAIGADGLECSDITGLCKCKGNVIGKQCDACVSKFAEVTNEGCKVLYANMCPLSRYKGILWRRSNYKSSSPQKCPLGSLGFAYRYCDSKTSWMEPDFSGCTSLQYSRFKNDLNNIENGETPLTYSRSSMLAYNLSQTMEKSTIAYTNDLSNSVKLIEKLLQFESNQTGFGLTASHDRTFTDNLVRASSSVLNNKSMHFWLESNLKKGNETSLSAPTLMKSWEEYTAALLRNLHLIYDKSSMSRYDNMNLDVYTVPFGSVPNAGFSYKNKWKEANESSNVIVTLPQNLFIGEQKGINYSLIQDRPTVGIVTYKNMNRILPKSFADDRTFRIPQKPSVNSAVVSVQVYRNSSTSSATTVHKLSDPVILTFALLNSDAVEPQCVFWNFTAKSSGKRPGGWSHFGCNREWYNKTHVECHCYHLTTFAVVTDESVSSVLDLLPVKIVVLLAASIAMLLLLFSFVTSLCLPGVTSVRAVINRNLSIAVFAANLVYAVGIQQTGDVYLCMAVAVSLHFLLLGAFAWIFVDGLHLYRKLSEQRDVNHGRTRVYYILGWIVPAIITALSVGLDAKGYGNSSFCWLSMGDVLIWSFFGPVLLASMSYVMLFIMSVNAFLSSKRADMKRKEISYEMKCSFFIAPSVMCTWVFATLAVNYNSTIYFYLFALLNLIQALLILLLHCLFNTEVREGYNKYKRRAANKTNLNTTTQQLLQSSMGITTDSSTRGGLIRYNNSTSESMASHKATSPMLPTAYDSDSDVSDSYVVSSSGSSMSLASSSDDNQVERNTYINIKTTKPDYKPPPIKPKPTNHLPTGNSRGNGRLPSNGSSHADQLIVKKRWIVENEDSLSEGSNETSV